MIAEAEAEHHRLVSHNEVVVSADRESSRMIGEARAEAQRLREEADDHLAFQTEENLRRGLPAAEARRQALLAFGSVEGFKESYRDQQSLPLVEHLLQDVRIALHDAIQI